MKTSSLIIALSTLLLTAPALAADPAATPGMDKRQAPQGKRIEQGTQSGQLTPRKANRQRDMNRDDRKAGKRYGKEDNPGKHYGKEGNPGKHKGWRNKKN